MMAITTKFSPDAKFTMLSLEEYSKINLKARLNFQNRNGKKLNLPARIKYPCAFLNRRALSISPELFINTCEGSTDVIDEKISKSSTKSRVHYKVSEQCKACNILPLCLGGCPVNEKFRSKCIAGKNC